MMESAFKFSLDKGNGQLNKTLTSGRQNCNMERWLEFFLAKGLVLVDFDAVDLAHNLKKNTFCWLPLSLLWW